MTSAVDSLPFYNAAKKTTQMMELMQRFSTCGSVDSFIHSSMALEPFVGPWPLLQFRNLSYTDGKTP
jgi:hypothetical protein